MMVLQRFVLISHMVSRIPDTSSFSLTRLFIFFTVFRKSCKPFIASNERKEKARYCQQGGTCAKAFARARKVLEAVDAGAGLDEALDSIGKISRRKLTDIATRNYYVLSLEFPNVDMETLERKGGDARK